MAIPDKLVEIREKNGYTRKRLADELGRPYRTITKYETGEREPGHEYLIEIAKKFGVTTYYILGLEEIKKSPGAEDSAPGEAAISLEDSNKLLEALGLIGEGQKLSDDDLAFLTHIVGLLETWFSKGH